MASSAVTLLTDPSLHGRISAAARDRVSERFCSERVVPLYEAYYEHVLERTPVAEKRGLSPFR